MIPEQGWKELTAPTKYKVFSTTGWSAPWFRKKHEVLVFPSEWWGFFTYTTTTNITITITADYPQTTPPKGAALNDAWDSVYWLAFDGILIYSGFWHNHPYITGYDFIPNIQQRTKFWSLLSWKWSNSKNGEKCELMPVFCVKFDFISMD